MSGETEKEVRKVLQEVQKMDSVERQKYLSLWDEFVVAIRLSGIARAFNSLLRHSSSTLLIRHIESLTGRKRTSFLKEVDAPATVLKIFNLWRRLHLSSENLQ
ncbi:MAG: hypothetical protein N2234_08120 [Planctomycetota bacterium]|nr:hypothetical protein [Planctomycetota bacterium]